MEEQKASDGIQTKSGSPLPAGVPINWGLITGPVPEPVFPVPPPQSSAVRALQTKVKSLTQRRARGGRDRARLDAEVGGPAGHISSEVFLRQRPRGRGLPPPAAGWRTGGAKDLSSSDEEEEEVEVEVQVKLEIHSPPAERAGGAGGPGGEGPPSDEFTFGETSPPPPPPPPHQEPSSSSSSSSSPSATSAPSASSSSSSSSSSSARRWAPPKGFWRVARPETLVLNGVGPGGGGGGGGGGPATLPLRDYTQTEAPAEPQQRNKATEPPEDESDAAAAEFKHSDSVECYLDRCEQKEAADGQGRGVCSSDSCESMTSQGGGPQGGGPPGGGSRGAPPCADEKLGVKERAYAKLRERQQNWKEERGSEDAPHALDSKGTQGVLDDSDPVLLAQELEPYLRSLLVLGDELPLSPRHEQAKRLLERARLKARSSHAKGDRPGRRSHSDQRATVKKEQSEPSSPTAVQKATPTKDDPPTQTATGPLLVPAQTDASPGEQGARPRRYGCSPTRVRFEDESEKEAESRYLDRVRQRGRPGAPRSRSKDGNADSAGAGGGSERGRGQRSVSVPPSQQRQDEAGGGGETATVFKEIIVLVKKCEACGSVVREPQPAASPPDPVGAEPQQPANPEEARGKAGLRGTPPSKPEPGTRPKAPLTVTFAGAFVLGENKESSTGWKSSGFGKLRRRSRKGESRLESGHGPYGPSWAQRRNSNPRNRVNLSRGVSFAPGGPVSPEPSPPEASGGQREPPAPSLPIKSALKSSSRSRSAAGQSTLQGGEGGSQAGLDPLETRRDSPAASAQGTPGTGSPVPCIRPSTLRYSPAQIPTDLPAGELWDGAADGAAVLSGDGVPSSEGRAPRGVAMSRAEDLRAELLRAEHLKAVPIWEENSDGSRKLDGRPKLFLRRFFSSIGLNSVGRLVKGGRSSSMEQLSIAPAPRAGSASPSPTRRPQPTIRIQRTPSLQSLHTVLPLAQLRKASSVQSLERRTERSTILGEVQIPYGLAPSPDSPQMELHRALSVEDVMVSRLARPVGRVAQAFPDGTLLLELVRPPKGPFGFVISRGKGRPDTGVYVEKVGDGSGEGPYVGLLGVGDEILQVNGEAVAGLSLDHVTRLMTRESTASLRIMPARRGQR